MSDMNTKPYETEVEVEKSGWWHGNIMLDTNQEISEEQYVELFDTDAISYETVCRLMELGAESGEAVPAHCLRDHVREHIEQTVLNGDTTGDIFGDGPTWEFWFKGTLEGEDIDWDDLSEASQEHIVHGILEDECRQGEISEYQCMNLTVSDFEFSDDGYITGKITLDDETCAFEYKVDTEEVSLHKYTAPGWLTGSSYETELPGDIKENIDAISEDVITAVTGYINEMDVRGTYPELFQSEDERSSLDDLINAAGEPVTGEPNKNDRDKDAR